LRIQPQVTEWINTGCARKYRTELKAYFIDEDFILNKITETLLFLSGSIYYQSTLSKSNSSKTRHKTVNSLMNKITPELGFEHTWRYLEVIVDFSKYYDLKKNKEYKNGTPNTKLTYTCNISDEIVEKLAEKSFKAFYAMPMLTPPKDWKVVEGKAVGGYEDFQLKLVRAVSKNVDYSKFSQKIFDSINYIQSTAWQVNIPLYNAVKDDLIAPKKENFMFTEYPVSENCMWETDLKDESTSLTKEEITAVTKERALYKNKIALYKAEEGDFETAMGKYRAVKLALGICEKYMNEDVIYFPHSYDFRGRVYPLPIGLSPQGSDAVKSMLMYKNGEVLNRDGAEWAFAYLASLYGDDKLDFAERVERGMELINADYKDADEPYQFLAHQLELKRVVADPTLEFKGRIHLDACNSGSQFTSVITGDLNGCLATNVIPTIEGGKTIRKDAYLLVAEKALALANKMIDKTKDHKKKETLKFLRDLLKNNGRKICKVPVMVSNYGGTTGGRTDILWNMFRELGVERKWIKRSTAALFSKIIGDSIVGVLQGGKAFELYIHKMNNIVAKNNKPIEWTTSDGFHVVHVKYKELPKKQVTCMLPSARKQTNIFKNSYSDNVNAQKMKSAISPNYIHSLDAELLRRVALRMKNEGIENTDWIHDSFGCHPNNVDLLLDVTKEEFRMLAERDPLNALDKELNSQVIESKASTKALLDVRVPELGGFKLEDLKIIDESDWFFS
jgi:DNA-directed RNA polymerase